MGSKKTTSGPGGPDNKQKCLGTRICISDGCTCDLEHGVGNRKKWGWNSSRRAQVLCPKLVL